MAKALPVLLARTFADHYSFSVLQKSLTKSRPLKNAITYTETIISFLTWVTPGAIHAAVSASFLSAHERT